MSKRIRRLIAAMTLTVLLSTGCTPEEIALFRFFTSHVDTQLSISQLAELRQCESTNNYSAVSPSGKYRGAYQFDQTTWDATAERFNFRGLIGLDPATVPWYWQDMMAQALHSHRGLQPWPQCGKKVSQ